MKKLLCFVSIAICGMLAAVQASAVSRPNNETVIAKSLISLSLLRESGIRNHFTDQLSNNMEKKWFNEFKDFYTEGQSPFFQDFFRNSLLLIGPGDKTGGITAIYDPWSDNILVLQIDNTQTTKFVKDYCFLPGAIFRQERINKNFIPQSVIPAIDPLEIALLKATANTRKKFMELFPLGRKKNSLSILPKATPETAVIMKRSMAMRFESAMNVLDNNKLFSKIVLCNKMIREFSSGDIEKFIEQSKGEKKMISVLTSQSQEVRKSYKIAYVVQGKNADTFAYANSRIPTMVVSIVIPKDKTKFYLTLLDLGYSSELFQKISSSKTQGGEK